MARQESQSKLLYYPTSQEVVSLLATWFANPTHSRLSDPCVGEGEALSLFAKLVGGESETWGVELSYSRAEKAKAVIGTVLPTDFYSVRWAKNTVSFILNNSPYDYSSFVDQRGKRVRHEHLFLIQSTPRLMAGGQHVIIVPRMMLRYEEFARHITGWYWPVLVFGYPNTQFDQIILLAQKRAEYQQPSNDRILNLMAWGAPDVQQTPLCECPGDHRRFVIPPAPPLPSDAFSYTPFSHEDQIAMTRAVLPRMFQNLQTGLHVRPVGAAMHPAIPENRGHISMELSSGNLGTLLIRDGNGSPLLTRGATKKAVTTTTEVVTNSKGEPTGTKVTETEKLVSTITTLAPDGTFKTVSDAYSVGGFITQNAAALTEALLKRNTPLYDFNPTESDWAITQTVGVNLPPLPGRDKRGLFDVQAHFSIAASMIMRKHHHAVMNCDMGFGKSVSSMSALSVLDEWPVILMAPGHMMEKWRRESTVSLDGVVARILDTGARPVVDITSKAKRVGGQVIKSQVEQDGRRRWILQSGLKAAKSILNYAASMWLDPRVDNADDQAWLGDLPTEPVAEEEDTNGNGNGKGDKRTWSFTCLNSTTSSHYHNVVVPAVEGVAWTEGTDGNVTKRHARIIKSLRVHVEPQPRTRSSPGHNGRRRQLSIELPAARRYELMEVLHRLRLQPQVLERHDDITVVEINDRDLYTLFDFVADYEAGLLGRRAIAITSFDSAKYDSGVDQFNGVTRRRYKLDKIKPKGQRAQTEYKTICPVCAHEVSKYSKEVGYCCNPVGPKLPSNPKKIVHPVFDEEGHIVQDDKKQPVARTVEGKVQICGAPLYNFSRWRRVGVGRLVRDKFPHFFKVYVADEVHKAQAGSTDIGAADGRFISGTKYSIALTGTLFGGIASSLFYLLFRRVKEVRTLYKYSDVSRWIEHYGAVKRTWFEADDVGQRGRSTNIERDRVNMKELPKIHPGLINFLLPQTLFAKITDLGYTLPPLYEDIERIEMTPRLAKLYNGIGEDIRQFAAKCAAQKPPDYRWFSIWFLFMLRWPNAAFRPDVYALKGASGFDTPAVVHGTDPKDLLPKEKRLVELVQRNLEASRKTLVFVEETSERDIRPRLEAVLEANISGCNAQTMSSSMAPARREAWIRQNAHTMDVLLVNPRLVETGLDLVMFSDIVFYELTYSLYTLWQAMRRVWRLGQSNPVTTTFLVYAGTTEEEALEWMGSKMKAGMILYGDNAAGALVDETEETEDDFRQAMIKKAIAGQVHETVGEKVGKLFGGDSRPVDLKRLVTGDKPQEDSCVFSVVMPVAIASRNNVSELLERVREGTLRVERRGGKAKPAPEVSSAQISLF